MDGSIDFDKTWKEYKCGFGNNMTTFDKNFWLGNDKIHLLTAGQDFTLRVEVTDCIGYRAREFYTGFHVNWFAW